MTIHVEQVVSNLPIGAKLSGIYCIEKNKLRKLIIISYKIKKFNIDIDLN
jgi:hypothetical protein